MPIRIGSHALARPPERLSIEPAGLDRRGAVLARASRGDLSKPTELEVIDRVQGAEGVKEKRRLAVTASRRERPRSVAYRE